MANRDDILNYCKERIGGEEFPDFKGAYNGLQVEGTDTIKKIGAVVDAGLIPFQKAIDQGVDFLIAHHGMFWTAPLPITGVHFKKLKLLMDHGINLYGAHLPLDAHEEIGNNAIIAKKLGLEGVDRFLEYEDVTIGLITNAPYERDELSKRLQELFPSSYTGIEYGSNKPQRIAICSGSGASAMDEIVKLGIDTFITGELRQNHFNFAQEHELNIYPCGHYATETFGVDALGRELAEKFGVEYTFIETECPL